MPDSLRFPPVVGSEYETRPTFWINEGDGYKRAYVESADLVKAIHSDPDALEFEFMKNGGRVYNDGRGPEFCPPECSDPAELAKHSIAMDEGYKESLVNYATRLADGRDDVGVMVRLHHRVVDSDGNTWGCHDNISIPSDLATALSANPQSQEEAVNPHAAFLLKHLMWRSFISGTGHVTTEGLRFAQKVDSVGNFNKYGFLSSYFRTDSQHGTRLEVRSGDYNLNNAAAMLRVGGAAIVAAMLETPLVKTLDMYGNITEPQQGRDFNILDLTPEGTIKPNSSLIQAVDGERRIVDAASLLPEYMDVPDVYKEIIGLWGEYCANFTKVMAGDATISLLAKHADWACKMQGVLEYVAADPVNRTQTDMGARLVDMAYDATTILVRGGKVGIKYGQGPKDQRDASLPYTPKADSVRLARTTPPATRAADRVRGLLGVAGVTSVTWDHLMYGGGIKKVFEPLYDW